MQRKGLVDGLSTQKPNSAAVEQILKMEPNVECTGDSMKLKVQDSSAIQGSLFLVDRGNYQFPKMFLTLVFFFFSFS